ncbi:hypothetical protein AM1_2671 [Acaryochloris marina MBIC11017]|uniref:Uncharacterized protein n=1 Tax=Acaryochloris marina (strain MBIC 11017) TaxID=329726 RepID=B0C7Z2_ACAM1|nr:hypothetical protein AM1_2671 [Acaryochloris marina MBIC11017]
MSLNLIFTIGRMLLKSQQMRLTITSKLNPQKIDAIES